MTTFLDVKKRAFFQPPKSEYVPYPHYQRVMKCKKEKEKRLEEHLRLTQMASRKKKKEQIKPKSAYLPPPTRTHPRTPRQHWC